MFINPYNVFIFLSVNFTSKRFIMSKIVIDPITRVEGHLKVEVNIKNSVVYDARCSADMYRGIEKALIGYDARAAQHITQRVCGLCPYAHSEAAALALEDAMGLKLNNNGRLLRNLIIGAYKLQDYLLHFYTLSVLDFIDIAAILDYKGKDKELLALKTWVKNELKSNKIFPSSLFLTRYKAAYSSNKELNITSIKHYLDAFDIMADIHKMVTIFGAKAPHIASIEAGGVTTKPTVDKIVKYGIILKKVKSFIYDFYLPDVIEVAKNFKSYFKIGKGPDSFLTFDTLSEVDGSYLFVGGFSKNWNFKKGVDPYKIVEHQGYSYYKKDGAFKPLELSELEPISWEEFEKARISGKKYSWSKAPRYDGEVVEVGPVAIIVNTYKSKQNLKLNKMVDKANKTLGISLKDYNSVMGRHLSRAIISAVIVDKLEKDLSLVVADEMGFIDQEIPKNAIGVGLTEATRGALAHFIQTDEKGFIKNYEMVVPTTWNISPKDGSEQKGALEQMLIGTKVADEDNPIEIARVARSTDPCLACSVH